MTTGNANHSADSYTTAVIRRMAWATIVCALFTGSAVWGSGWQDATATGDIPSPRCDHSMTRIGDLIYLYGGRAAGNIKSITDTFDDLYTYDPETGVFSRKSKSPGENPPPLYGHSAQTDGQNLFLFGGTNASTGPSDKVWKYDPTKGTWTEVETSSPRPAARYYAGSLRINKKIWLTGGIRQKTELHTYVHPDAWVYDTQTSTWEQKADIPQGGRYAHGMTQSISDTMPIGSFYIIGGSAEYGVQYTGFFYNSKTNSWDFVVPQNSPPPVAHSAFVQTVTRAGMFYRFGGYGYPSSSSKQNKNEWESTVGEVWRLDLNHLVWTRLADIPPVVNAAAALISEPETPEEPANILLFGGLNENQGAIDDAIVFTDSDDPVIPDPTPTPPPSGVKNWDGYR